jgi:branched-chain amino acid transport system substrate-binding protein
VVVYEREQAVGGHVRAYGALPYRQQFGSIATWLAEQARGNGSEIKLTTPVTRENIDAIIAFEKPDHVVVASGARYRRDGFQGQTGKRLPTGSVRAIMGPDTNSWFFIASDFAFGHALERDAAAAVEKLGGKVIGRVWPPFNNADFSSFLLRAQQSGASVIAFATAGQDTINLVKQASEFGLAKPGTRVVPMQLMLDEVKAIGLPLGQGDYATMAFHHDRSPEARIWAQRFFERMKAMPTQIQAGTFSAVRHYLQAVRDGGTDEPLAVMAKMRATPVNDIFASGGYIREDGRMVHDMFLVQIKTPAESKEPWDLIKIIKIIPGDEAFRPLSESECPLLKKKS